MIYVDFRASADKLLSHSFFRSCRKPSYLVEVVVKLLPPVSERPHLGSLCVVQNVVNNNLESAESEALEDSAQSWDFNTDENTLLSEEKIQFKGDTKQSDQESHRFAAKKSRFVVLNEVANDSGLNCLTNENEQNGSCINPNFEVRKGRFCVVDYEGLPNSLQFC